MSVPTSVIHILSGVPINNSYEHTLYFSTKAEQTNYFRTKLVKTFDRYTYLRPGNIIKVAGDIANARNWNYLMFQNDSGKWYYHFITKVVYLNDSAVEIHVELDVMQTYMFDWELHPCFIERMHTESDEFGEHTIPEGLETGPLIRDSEQEINLEDNCILIMMSCNENGGQAWGKMYGGVYSGLAVYAVSADRPTALTAWLENASSGGYVDAIVSMWMYPKDLVSIEGTWGDLDTFHVVNNVADFIEETVEDPLTNYKSIDGWIVQNKKTFCYPYTMMYVSNNMGGCAVYHRERFNPETPGKYKFRIYGALSPDSGVQLTPEHYKMTSGSVLNFEESLSLPAFPTCAWNSDTYKVWLAQNQNSQELAIQQAKIQAVAGAVTAVGSAPIGNIMGSVGGLATAYNAYNTVQGIMAQRADMAVQPDQARGTHSGNINLTHGRHGFSVYFMTITGEYAKSIDQYFSRYGYKVNIVATPKLRTRELFTFVKTVGSLVTGNLGTEDQLKIQAVFDKGVTFWADPSKVGSFFNSNKPL